MGHFSSLLAKSLADRYRIDQLPLTGDPKKDFETEEQCASVRDPHRAAVAGKAAKSDARKATRKAARRLAKVLRYDHLHGSPPASLASALFFRGIRVSFIGRIWEMVEERLPAGLQVTLTTATISPPDSDVHEDQLHSFRPAPFLKRFRAALYRNGMAEAGGWGCFVIHAEYDASSGMFRFHLHAVVCGGMVAVLDKLRRDKAWQPIKRQVGSQIKLYPRIRIKRQLLVDLPNAIGYVIKSYWPSKWEGEIDGEAKRQKGHGRIRDAVAHTRALLWLDRHSIDEITLLVGVRATAEGLIPNKLGSVNEKEGRMRQNPS